MSYTAMPCGWLDAPHLQYHIETDEVRNNLQRYLHGERHEASVLIGFGVGDQLQLFTLGTEC